MIPLRRCKFPSFYQFHLSHPSRIPSLTLSAMNACARSAAYPSPSSPGETVSDLAAYRLSLLAGLARRGLLSAAHNVSQRIIISSSSLEAAAALSYAISLGLPIDLGRLLRSLITAGQLHKADVLFNHSSKDKVSMDSAVLNSMIECYCKLWKLDVAETYLDELVKIGCLPTARAYVAVLRARCGKGKYMDAFNLFCAIAAQEGLLPPLSVYNAMIFGLCSIGCLDHARFMFDFMFNLGLPLSPRSYKALVYGLSKASRVLEAENLCNKMESRGFWLDCTLCTSLINGYQKEGRMELALKIFNRMQEMSWCQPDTYAYNTIIHGVLKLGHLDSAWKLFNQMVERGLKRNVVTYCMMINWHSKNRRVDQAMELLKEMYESGLPPNLQCYTVLVTSLCMERRMVEAEQLFDKMLDSGIVPDHVMFSVLMKNLPRGHRPMVIKKTLHAIADWKIDLSRVSNISSCNEGFKGEIEVLLDEIMKSDVFPVHLIFNVLLCVFCTEGNIDLACNFMETMVSWGYEPSISTYNFLLRCMSKEGHLEDAGSRVSLLVHHQGVPSSLTAYSIKINALCKNGQVDLALEQLDEMIQKGFDPTVSIYDSIIGSLCRAGRIRKADMTFNNMLKAGVNPDEVVYATLINGHCVLGRAVRACHLFDQMMQRGLLPSSRAYSALINGLIKKNMYKNACHYLDRMLEDGFVPDTVLYTMLVNQFLRKGEVGLALYIFDLMVRNQIEPDLVAYGSLICGLCGHKSGARNLSLTRKLKKTRHIVYRLESRGKHTSRMLQSKRLSSMSITEKVNFALEKVQDLVYRGLVPDLHIYNGIINGLCGCNRIEDAYNHIADMHNHGIAANQVTYTILMKAFIRSGDINCATWLFNQMSSNGCIPDKMSYNTLIVGFCITGRVIEGLSLVHGMQKRGLLPNKILYDQLLKFIVPCCPSNLAILLLEEMISHNHVPHSSNYNKLLWVLSTKANLLEIRRVYNLILKLGRIPDETTKKQLLKICHSKGEFNMALKIMENMPINND
ncbi:pentatricopeptide repeat-containing protein At5g62370 [Phalaenopsis equestris]|uniref:pentatricopeptide repeat-containing protein At5g62370 n=1 Tax=Phalaenopsis equestris TaxID=78828 RepID=UPI0009E4DCB4|nr:pentatricopeptide repeat-containing protein At5g62370 [Phalaenopsis equestris]XP_020595429.1 pentatricopeptide repeat-containing protein At5g62370 [Phalaenopsis equestris]XP_020595430.1 pentatricopeptide repeat-containing protein At5g62370 [Phalaenopsis equestris]XP_020595431.1 pentatricopeptide repeat-containing protein At5g62370 [Phalaenopsis equestris]XP_020595432.1 pentatricopeptide repeat-containing protein At5g62370 [Phalaenopsis equestris]XP_020595433.1 pentatricopeptide repeat-conta